MNEKKGKRSARNKSSGKYKKQADRTAANKVRAEKRSQRRRAVVAARSK